MDDVREQGHLDVVIEPTDFGPGVLARAAASTGLPEPLAVVLEQVIAALVRGEAVTITSRDLTLSTQEAADLLGVSRPTLVRLLERGALAYDQPGTHRRVLLHDLREFQRAHHHNLTALEEAPDA